MSNQARNIIKNNTKNHKKKLLKQYKHDAWFDFGNVLPVIGYGVIFFIEAFINERVNFSILLAEFSFCITFSFEVSEWVKFHYQKTMTPYQYSEKMLIKFPALPFFFVMLFLIGIHYLLKHFLSRFTINEFWLIRLPNIMTAGTLLIYFVSFVYRNHKLRKYIFLHPPKK